MTTELIDSVLHASLYWEGGLSDAAADKGGLTNFGLTKPFLHAVTGREWSDADVTSLSRERAMSIYRLWMQLRRLDQLPEDMLLGWIVTDYAMHSGERRAIRSLQSAMGIPADGIAGAETQGTWHRLSADECRVMAVKVLAERIEFLGGVITADPSQCRFARGWFRRVAAQVRACA